MTNTVRRQGHTGLLDIVTNREAERPCTPLATKPTLETGRKEQLSDSDERQKVPQMKVADVLTTAKDSMAVSRVFGEPIERDGITMIAAAAISGGGGAGEGGDDTGQGSGGGFGLGAKPVGAFIIKDGQVSWQPSVDVNRMALVAGVVVVTALIVGARIARLFAR
ncbi:hypothetical protein [Nocardia sp. NPDC049149]|uniref:hypothetical protein n=1 Tax=Nocardia sp. NPDC049149 TaxID=3364315 RepID=UPI003712DECE